MSRAIRLAREVQEMFKQADGENRPLTAEERAYAQERLDEAEDVGRAEKQIDDIGRRLGAPSALAGWGSSELAAPQDPGARFLQSPGWKAVSDSTARGESWSTGLIEVSDAPHWQMKGTLLEGAGAPGSGTGGGMVAAPQVIPGVVQTLTQPLALEGLLGGGIADGNTVRYVVEGTATSGAGGVAEAGTKPESTLGLSTRDEPVKKIATFLPISDELLEDAPAVQQFISGRLGLFVNVEVERELLRGTSGGNEVQGLLTGRGVPVFNGGTADNKAVQVFKALNSMRGSALIEPEWIVISPADYQTIRLLTDSAGQFFGGGPFSGAYGNAGAASASGQVSGFQDALWSKPVYVSQVMGAGTALIGTSANAAVWARGGLRVEFSNSHSGFFQQNMVAVRAERRLALAVYRASGYVECRLAVGPGG